MEVTVGHLEKVISLLKGVAFFSFAVEEANTGTWDVFPDVDDPRSFVPREHGDAPAYLTWARDAGERAFDERGILRHPLAMWWGGSFASLQTAFAEAGLVVRIERDDEPAEGYEASGRLVLSPASRSMSCDLTTILGVFATLKERGIVALANAGGWLDIAEHAASVPDTAVFWTADEHDAFDAVGNIGGELLLEWRGDAAVIIEALREVGLVVEDRPEENHPIRVISGMPTPIYLETFDEAATSTRGNVGRVVTPADGPLFLVGAFRSKEWHPVTSLAIDPPRPGRIAFVQSFEAGATPSARWAIVDERGEVERELQPLDRWSRGIGGMCILSDGRFVYCMKQPGSLELRVDEEVIWTRQYTSISGSTILTIDADERYLVIGEGDGASVYEVPPAGSAWAEPRRLTLPPGEFRPYTRTAISPNGEWVAWCDDWSSPLALFERESGRLVWRHPPEQEAKAALRFSPDSQCVALLVGRDRASRSLRFSSTETGAAIHRHLTAEGTTCFAFHPGGRVLATGRNDGTVRLFGFPDGRCSDIRIFTVGGVSAIEFARDGAYLAVGGTKGDVALFRCGPIEVLSGLPIVDPAPKQRASLGAKWVSPLVGARGRLVAGLFANHAATVLAVGSGGSKLRVEVLSWGRPMPQVVDATAFKSDEELARVSDACPFRPGDTVLAHGGFRHDGLELVLTAVDEVEKCVFFTVIDEEDAENAEEAALSFTDVTLVRPLRRDPLPEYLAALGRAKIPPACQQALQAWALRHLSAVDWDLDHPSLASSGELAREFGELEERAYEEASRGPCRRSSRPCVPSTPTRRRGGATRRSRFESGCRRKPGSCGARARGQSQRRMCIFSWSTPRG